MFIELRVNMKIRILHEVLCDGLGAKGGEAGTTASTGNGAGNHVSR